MKSFRHHAETIGRLVLDVAPVLALLTRASHPVAWVGAAVFVGERIYKEVKSDRRCLWPHLSFPQRTAILSAASAAGAGYVQHSDNGYDYRVLDGVTYAAANDWSHGPIGKNANVIPTWLWQHYGQSLVVSRDETDELALTAEPSIHFPPSATAQAIAAVMKPCAVILDDVDRGPTDGALDAVDRLQAMGVAVLASSNEADKICSALIRDGRIDDHRTFGAIEPDMLERLTAGHGLGPELLATLATRTVSTVSRFVERRVALGHERAMEFLTAAPIVKS